MKKVFLNGTKLYLRGMDIDDLNGGYSSWINDQQNDIYTSHAIFPHTHKTLLSYFNNTVLSENNLILAIIDKESDDHIGNIGLHKIDYINRCATLGILIGLPNYHNRGYATEALSLLVMHAFNRMNLHKIELGVHEDNKPAIKLYHKCGFVIEGIKKESVMRAGRYENIVIMGLINPLHHEK